MTPLPVPIQSLFDDTRREVMRTKENPSFPVPAQHKKLFTKAIQSKINILLLIYIYISDINIFTIISDIILERK